MAATALKASGDEPRADWLFGPEVERAYQWFLETFRETVAPLRSDLVDALLAGDIGPTSGSVAIDVRHVVHTYTSDLVLVFSEGTDRGAHAGREVAARKFPLDIDFSLVPQRVLDEFGEWSHEAVDSSLETMTEDVTNLVRGAQEEGLSIDAIAEEIDAMMGNRYVENGSWKSRQIGRSATIPSSNAGAHSAYQDAESVLAETWLATPDNKTRPAHRRMDGQTKAVNVPFLLTQDGIEYEARFVGDPTLPLSLWLNERCTSIPTFGDQLTDEQRETIQSGGRVYI